MNKTFQSIAAAATMLIVGLFIVSAIYGTMPASESHTVTNESVTADVGNWTQVAETYGTNYYENETVYNSTDTQLVEGTDYEWAPGNQSLYFYSTTSVSDGESMNATYSFDAKPEAARNSIGTIGDSFTLGAVAVIVLVAALILAIIGDFNGESRGGRRL